MKFKCLLFALFFFICPSIALGQNGTINLNKFPPATTIPLNGTEPVYIWQNGASKQVPSSSILALPVLNEHLWYGQNGNIACPLTESAGVITPAVTSCPAGATTYGVEFQNVTLAAGANYQAFPTGAVIGQPFVFSYTQGATQGTLTLASGYIFQGSSSQPTLSSTPGTVDKIQCWGDGTGAVGTTATGITCNQPLLNYQPLLGMSIPATSGHGFGTQCGNSGQSSCVGSSITVTNGQLFAVLSYTGSNGVTPPTVTTITKSSGTATFGSCALGGAGHSAVDNASALYWRLEAWRCTATSSGTIVPQVNYSSAVGIQQLIGEVVIQNAVAEDTIGNGADQTNQGATTTVSVSSTAPTIQPGEMCVSLVYDPTGTTVTGSGTQIDNVFSGALISMYQNGGMANATVTATGTGNGPYDIALVFECFEGH